MSVIQWKQLGWEWIGSGLFRLSPHMAHGYRRMILTVFGAQVHRTAKIRRSARITHPWNLSLGELAIVGDHAMLDCSGTISIGSRSVVSQLAVLTTSIRSLLEENHPCIIAPICIQDDAWVATDTLVLPGSIVSDGSVIGSRGLVEGTTTEPWKVSVGHPVSAIKDRTMRERRM